MHLKISLAFLSKQLLETAVKTGHSAGHTLPPRDFTVAVPGSRAKSILQKNLAKKTALLILSFMFICSIKEI